LLAILPHAPETVLAQVTLQTGVTAFDSTVAVYACCAPAFTAASVGVITIGGRVTVTVDEAVLEVSAVDTAVTVTGFCDGTELGAVYNPFVSIVPKVAFPPVAPLTCQVTAVFVEKVTAAENCWVCPAPTDAVAGVTAMGKAMVTLASAVLLTFATEIAVMVTAGTLGTAAGAVYRPVPEIVPWVASPPVAPLTFQVTSLLVSCRVAVNCWVPLMVTVALVGEMDMGWLLELLLPPPHPQNTARRATQAAQE
jgi:hypothetical protein